MYEWIKVCHVISVISWMAGLLYLPRLFVYHADVKNNIEQLETFKIMERRLFLAIILPSSVASWIFGTLLIVTGKLYISMDLWLHMKLIITVFLTIFMILLNHYRKNFLSDVNNRSSTFFRYLNEIPTIFMIVIVILVIIKPF